MRPKVEGAFNSYLQGKLDYHSMNFELLMDNPRPIPEHTDFMAALEEELSKEYVQWMDENVDFPPEELWQKFVDIDFFRSSIPENR